MNDMNDFNHFMWFNLQHLMFSDIAELFVNGVSPPLAQARFFSDDEDSPILIFITKPISGEELDTFGVQRYLFPEMIGWDKFGQQEFEFGPLQAQPLTSKRLREMYS